MSDLSARLLDLRRSRSVRQSSLATALNVSSALVSSWETGSAVPPTERLVQIAGFYQPEDPDALLSELVELREHLAPVRRDASMAGVQAITLTAENGWRINALVDFGPSTFVTEPVLLAVLSIDVREGLIKQLRELPDL